MYDFKLEGFGVVFQRGEEDSSLGLQIHLPASITSQIEKTVKRTFGHDKLCDFSQLGARIESGQLILEGDIVVTS